MDFDRYWIQALPATDLRVLVRTGGRPIKDYAVILERRRSGIRPRWRAICVIDNHLDTCHMHRYNGNTRLDPEPFIAGAGLTTNEQLANAIRHMVEHHQAMFDGWHRRQS
jgi:hypothetical protein